MATTVRRPKKVIRFRREYDEAAWRAAHGTRTYVVPGMEYEDYAPAYRYGVLVADKHGKKEFAEVEPLLADEWATVRGRSRLDWAMARPAVHEAYAGVVKVRPVRSRTIRRTTKTRTNHRKQTATRRTITARATGRGRTHGDLSKRGPRDRSRVNVNEPWEVRYWSGRLGVTSAQLRRAVKSAGPEVKNVRR